MAKQAGQANHLSQVQISVLGDPQTAARFWGKVTKTQACWTWVGERGRDGYGRFYLAGRRVSAHRIAYFLAGHIIPEGLEIDHLCRIRWCVRPSHLEPVTHRENIKRSPLMGQGGFDLGSLHRHKTHCRQGHPYDEMNTYHPQYMARRVCRACQTTYSRLRRAVKRVLRVVP